MNRLIFLGLLISSGAFAQQKIAINEAEEAFVKNNLQLLAQQYNISIADADIIQAKIWNLPEASFQANVYNPEDKKIFDVGPSKSFAVQQLFLLGGKRKNEVENQLCLVSLFLNNASSAKSWHPHFFTLHKSVVD